MGNLREAARHGTFQGHASRVADGFQCTEKRKVILTILRQGDEGRVLDDPCWWVTCHGTDLSGKAQTINYFLNKNFTRIYAISQDVLDGSGADIILEEWDPIQLECGCEIAVWRSRS